MAAANANRWCWLWRADESIRFQHQLGQRADGRGGSQRESLQPRLAAGANQHAHRRRGLFQRSAMDELSRPLLPPPLAVIRSAPVPRRSDEIRPTASDLPSRMAIWTSLGMRTDALRTIASSAGCVILLPRKVAEGMARRSRNPRSADSLVRGLLTCGSGLADKAVRAPRKSSQHAKMFEYSTTKKTFSLLRLLRLFAADSPASSHRHGASRTR